MRTLGVLVAVLLCLGAAACDAPLEPESRKAATASSSPDPEASTAASSEASVAPEASMAPNRTASVGATPRTIPSPPKITVPPLPRLTTLPGGLLGADSSWPQCPKGMGIPQKRGQGSPMPLAGARYVILGLTNGPGFTANPCLADQVEWVRSRGLLLGAYAVVSGPNQLTPSGATGRGPYDAGTARGRMANLGFQQARFSIAVMERLGIEVPAVWLDVEPVPSFDWGTDTRLNAAVVTGAARAYREAGFTVGAYSTPALWQRVVGDLRLGVPEWRAAGQTSRAEAVRRCGRAYSFQGGKGLLGQWVEDGRDQNIVCPGADLAAAHWFHRFPGGRHP